MFARFSITIIIIITETTVKLQQYCIEKEGRRRRRSARKKTKFFLHILTVPISLCSIFVHFLFTILSKPPSCHYFAYCKRKERDPYFCEIFQFVGTVKFICSPILTSQLIRQSQSALLHSQSSREELES